MQRTQRMLACLVLPALAAGVASFPVHAGSASGQGLVWVPPGSGFTDDLKPFEAKDADAHRASEDGHTRGKIVVTV